MYTSGLNFEREIWLEVDRENDWEMEKILKIGEFPRKVVKIKIKTKSQLYVHKVHKDYLFYFHE